MNKIITNYFNNNIPQFIIVLVLSLLCFLFYNLVILEKKNRLIKFTLQPNSISPNYFINIRNKVYFLLKKHKIVTNKYNKENIKLEIKDPMASLFNNSNESSYIINIYIYIQPEYFNTSIDKKLINYSLDSLLFQLSLSLRKLDIHIQNIKKIKLLDEGYENLNIKEPHVYELYNLQIIQNKLILLNTDSYKNTDIILNMIYKNYLFSQKYLQSNSLKENFNAEILNDFIFESYILGIPMNEIVNFISKKENTNIKVDEIDVQNSIQKAQGFMNKFNVSSRDLTSIFKKKPTSQLSQTIETPHDLFGSNNTINTINTINIPKVNNNSIISNSSRSSEKDNGLINNIMDNTYNFNNIIDLAQDYINGITTTTPSPIPITTSLTTSTISTTLPNTCGTGKYMDKFTNTCKFCFKECSNKSYFKSENCGTHENIKCKPCLADQFTKNDGLHCKCEDSGKYIDKRDDYKCKNKNRCKYNQKLNVADDYSPGICSPCETNKIAAIVDNHIKTNCNIGLVDKNAAGNCPADSTVFNLNKRKCYSL